MMTTKAAAGRAPSAAELVAEATGGAPPEAAVAAKPVVIAGDDQLKVAAATLDQMIKDREKLLITKRPNPASDVKRHGGESDRSDWDVTVPDEVLPEDITQFPTYLFLIRERGVKRYDEITVHTRTWRWEQKFRVLNIDQITQEMQLSPTGPLVVHTLRPSKFNWDTVEYENLGTAGVRVHFRRQPIATFETREEAEEYVNRKKSGVF